MMGQCTSIHDLMVHQCMGTTRGLATPVVQRQQQGSDGDTESSDKDK